MDNILTVLEGLLFLSGDEGLTIDQLIGSIECDRESVESGLNQLMDQYLDESHGIEHVSMTMPRSYLQTAGCPPYLRLHWKRWRSLLISSRLRVRKLKKSVGLGVI